MGFAGTASSTTEQGAVVPVSLDELCTYLLENNIAKNKLPEFLEVVDEMPLTPTRKIIKGRLKRTATQTRAC